LRKRMVEEGDDVEIERLKHLGKVDRISDEWD
jgi:hypothetical protein